MAVSDDVLLLLLVLVTPMTSLEGIFEGLVSFFFFSNGNIGLGGCFLFIFSKLGPCVHLLVVSCFIVHILGQTADVTGFLFDPSYCFLSALPGEAGRPDWEGKMFSNLFPTLFKVFKPWQEA